MTVVKQRVGRPADTAKRLRILAELTVIDQEQLFQVGVPPYNVGRLAESLNMDASNLRKDLLKLEVEGLVVREYAKVSSWNAISKDHIERTCLCFWNAATMTQDKLAGEEWTNGAKARSEGAFDRFFSHQK